MIEVKFTFASSVNDGTEATRLAHRVGHFGYSVFGTDRGHTHSAPFVLIPACRSWDKHLIWVAVSGVVING
jgi:hypothetical protein